MTRDTLPDLPSGLPADGTVLVARGRHGWVLYPTRDAFVGRSVALYGDWSPGDAAVARPFLRPGMTALDIGANLGTFTLFLSAAVGPAGRVLAFEPVPALHALLAATVALNGLPQVTPVASAVGRASGQARVPDLRLDRDGNFGATQVGGEDATVAVPLVALDDLDLPACDFVKADVEGGEEAVLAGADRTIARYRPVVLLENEEPSLSPALIGRLLDLGYRLWWHSPPLFDPDLMRGRENVFPGLGSLNLVALPCERSDVPTGLRQVTGPDDWPAWWPNWSAQ